MPFIVLRYIPAELCEWYRQVALLRYISSVSAHPTQKTFVDSAAGFFFFFSCFTDISETTESANGIELQAWSPTGCAICACGTAFATTWPRVSRIMFFLQKQKTKHTGICLSACLRGSMTGTNINKTAFQFIKFASQTALSSYLSHTVCIMFPFFFFSPQQGEMKDLFETQPAFIPFQRES